MNQMEIKELADRVKALSAEERKIVIDNLPVTEMLHAISDRYEKVVEFKQSIETIVNKL